MNLGSLPHAQEQQGRPLECCVIVMRIIGKLCKHAGEWRPCAGVPLHRINFYCLVGCVCVALALFLAALGEAHHYGMKFPLGPHLFPFFFVAIAHLCFVGLDADEGSDLYVQNPHECDRSMARIGMAVLFCVIASVFAFYVNLTLWWHEEPEFSAAVPISGPTPSMIVYDTSESPTPSRRATDNNPIPVWLRTPTATTTPSRTPQPTPTPSADPVKIARREEVLSSTETLVGVLFLFSVLWACLSVHYNYKYKTCERGLNL